MNPIRSIIFITLLAACAAADARRPQARGEAGQFDYYAVSLSWSPSYCATHSDPNQCDRARPLGFVLHGLWPQYVNGYPESCSNQRLPSEVRARYASLFPSPGMIEHEWKKHGTCSGLDPASYFALSARLKDGVAVPGAFQQPLAPVRTNRSDLARAFKAANPALAPDAVLPFCGGGGRFLREVRVCFDKRGASASCSPAEVKRSANSCRQDSFLLQSVKGAR
ncbi:MAG: ribonuclease T2 family protein [Gammaproteobacteria bacterium]